MFRFEGLLNHDETIYYCQVRLELVVRAEKLSSSQNRFLGPSLGLCEVGTDGEFCEVGTGCQVIKVGNGGEVEPLWRIQNPGELEGPVDRTGNWKGKVEGKGSKGIFPTTHFPEDRRR